jgi:type VI secretion system protein ImpB
MPEEGSVAPKERINIVYKPATNVQEEVELPLKLLFIGTCSPKKDNRPIEERPRINIDKDNFNKVMAEQNLTLSISVPNRLSDHPGDELPVTLKIENLKDLSPESIVQQVDELRKLIEVREALKALKHPMGNVPAFRRKLESLLADETARQRLLKELGIESGGETPA